MYEKLSIINTGAQFQENVPFDSRKLHFFQELKALHILQIVLKREITCMGLIMLVSLIIQLVVGSASPIWFPESSSKRNLNEYFCNSMDKGLLDES
jgi:p-aminobenzoyl-glutamate transporter AbgT